MKGGILGFSGDQVQAVKDATNKWIAESKDPKAAFAPFFFNVLGTVSL